MMHSRTLNLLVSALLLCMLLALSSCETLGSKAHRRQIAYQRYVKKSMRERNKRRKIIAKEKIAEANRLAAEARSASVAPPAP